MFEFQSLIEQLELSATKERAVTALARYLHCVGIEHYAYLGFRGGSARQTEPYRAGFYPARWIDEYMGERLYIVDPIIAAAAQSTLPVMWSHYTSKKVWTPDPVLERASQFGLRSGCTIPIRSSIGQLATLTVATDLSHDAFARLIENRHGELHLGAFYFHNAIERIAAPNRDTQLSPRERTCLMFAAQGLSAKAIARVLEISPRAVKFHLDNTRAKLGAANLQQAIHTANYLGLI